MPFIVDRTIVLQPAPATPLVTRASLKALLGITGTAQDRTLDDLVAQASASAARYCNRATFAVETLRDDVWPNRQMSSTSCAFALPPTEGCIQLSRWPVTAVTAIVADGTSLVASDPATGSLAGADVAVDTARGQMLRLGAGGIPIAWCNGAVSTIYAAGYAVVPPDLADAVARMVKAQYFARTRDPQVRSESIPGVHEASYWFGAGPGSSGGLPPDIVAILDTYRVPANG